MQEAMFSYLQSVHKARENVLKQLCGLAIFQCFNFEDLC